MLKYYSIDTEVNYRMVQNGNPIQNKRATGSSFIQQQFEISQNNDRKLKLYNNIFEWSSVPSNPSLFLTFSQILSTTETSTCTYRLYSVMPSKHFQTFPLIFKNVIAFFFLSFTIFWLNFSSTFLVQDGTRRRRRRLVKQSHHAEITILQCSSL